MFHHVKELQFNARVSEADPRFARLLLEQFGGANGELKAALQYFVQSFGARQAFPEHYDMLMDIATEEFSHLEIVGATITMLLNGIQGDLKDAAERSGLMRLVHGKAEKEQMIHDAMSDPQFFALSGGGPTLTNSMGVPFSGAYISANGDLTVDLRSNMAAESRAKIVYEYLIQFTDDPLVKESLSFLMTREITHYQVFAQALETIAPNFPQGVLQGDPTFSNLYFNMSDGASARGPWNQGTNMMGEQWQYIEDPIRHVVETRGMTDQTPQGTERTRESALEASKELGQKRSEQARRWIPKGRNQWSSYPQRELTSPMGVEDGAAS